MTPVTTVDARMEGGAYLMANVTVSGDFTGPSVNFPVQKISMARTVVGLVPVERMQYVHRMWVTVGARMAWGESYWLYLLPGYSKCNTFPPPQ